MIGVNTLINNEIYRLLDNSPAGISYNIFNGYKEENGYRFIFDQITTDYWSGRLRRYEMDWTNPTILISGLGTERISDVYYYKNYYYVCYHYSNVINKFDLNFTLETPVTTFLFTNPCKIWKYKNYWFVLRTTNWSITRYDEDINDGSFTLNNPRIFTDAVDFGNQFNTDYSAYHNVFNIIVNYQNGELIITSHNAALTDSWANRFSLDNMVKDTGIFFIDKYSSLSNQIPFLQLQYSPLNLDGHYIFFQREAPAANHKFIGYWILDHDFNIVQKTMNLNIVARQMHPYREQIQIVPAHNTNLVTKQII